MGRPKAEYPTPGKRLRNERWQCYWSYAGHSYGVAVGQVSEREAETCRLELLLGLQSGAWPEWAADAPAVRRYVAARAAEGSPEQQSLDVLADYEPHLLAHISERWAQATIRRLRELRDWTGRPLLTLTPADAQAFLDHLRTSPGRTSRDKKQGRSIATVNRALAVLGKFYKWAVRTERTESNPFRDMKQQKEPRPSEIAHLTHAERDEVLAAADALRDGVAVWLGMYTGMRRGEIAACRWGDLRLDTGRIVIPKTKTGTPRVVPLAGALAERLAELRPTGATGRIVPWPAEYGKWQAHANRLLMALEKACPHVPPERIRWNVFRHTFGSLLAQAGVSLDKISSWLGNSPTVCRRHYAEFTPRDRRDEEIDLLNGGTDGHNRDGQDRQDKATT